MLRSRIDLTAAAAVVLSFAACTDSSTDPHMLEGVDLDALFAPPAAEEIAAVAADWEGRQTVAVNVREEQTSDATLDGRPATLRILSHTMDGARHYGAVLAQEGVPPGALAVIVYAHGGDGGISVEELEWFASQFGERADDYVFVAPSFRSEPLVAGAKEYLSEGEPSPWDRDVDDALALLDAVLETTPAADPARIGVVGLSRGGGVALLMAERDRRIDAVVEFFGPTDFFDSYVQEIVEEALGGTLRDLPGLEVLNERLIQPLKEGLVTIEEVRVEMLRRSAVYFAEALPAVQVHHGTADDVVDVSQAKQLREALEALGPSAPESEVFIYPGGRHDVVGLETGIPRAVDFLSRFLDGADVQSRRLQAHR